MHSFSKRPFVRPKIRDQNPDPFSLVLKILKLTPLGHTYSTVLESFVSLQSKYKICLCL